MRSQLNSFGVNFEIIDATDGYALDLSQIKDRLRQDKAEKYYGYALRPGEIGCYLSHHNLWQTIVKNNIEYALILEDDAKLAPDFFTAVSEIVNSEWKWEFVNMSTVRPAKICNTLQTVGNGRKFGLASRSGSTLAAYLIHISAAKKLLHYCHEIRAPIDVLTVQWWQHKAVLYYVSPPPASQFQQDASGTGQARVNRSFLPSLLRKQDRLRRFWAVKTHRPQKQHITAK